MELFNNYSQSVFCCCNLIPRVLRIGLSFPHFCVIICHHVTSNDMFRRGPIQPLLYPLPTGRIAHCNIIGAPLQTQPSHLHGYSSPLSPCFPPASPRRASVLPPNNPLDELPSMESGPMPPQPKTRSHPWPCSALTEPMLMLWCAFYSSFPSLMPIDPMMSLWGAKKNLVVEWSADIFNHRYFFVDFDFDTISTPHQPKLRV